MNYMVVYWNGRGTREKMFRSREHALYFISQLVDAQPTLWVQEKLDE